MANWIERAEQQLTNHAVVLRAIEGIGRLIKTALVDPKNDANAVLQVVERVIDALIAGFDGKVTRAEVEGIIAKMNERKEERDSRFDKALDEKFDSKETP